MINALTTQQTLRLSLLGAVAARDALALLNVESMLSARVAMAQLIMAVKAIDAELDKIKQEAKA